MRRLQWLVLALSFVGLVAISGWAGRRLHIAGKNPCVFSSQFRQPAEAIQKVPGANAAQSRQQVAPVRSGFEVEAGLDVRRSSVIHLRNTSFDTAGTPPFIPQDFRASPTPGAYLIQARDGALHQLQQELSRCGTEIVSFVPNNAFLVKAQDGGAEPDLLKLEHAQRILPLEPFYKAEPALLREYERFVAKSSELATTLQVLLLPGTESSFRKRISASRFKISGSAEEHPFGHIIDVSCPLADLARLAKMPEVQAIELARKRIPALDRARVVSGIAALQPAPSGSNYEGLSGTNVTVALSDSGLDVAHPDLQGRAAVAVNSMTNDIQGHGTFMAGIIAGSGSHSAETAFVPGSVYPAQSGQFHGVAFGSSVYGIPAGPQMSNAFSDMEIQRAAASAGACILNNGWVYSSAFDYDFAAAAYDAAVRDALEDLPGSQPLIMVIPAGNSGGGLPDGTGGIAGTIASPATAKNVISVGALEQSRFITNTVIECAGPPPGTNCVTNAPCLQDSDSASQVAAYSGRGNVGMGIEGEWGRMKPDLVAPGSFIVSTRSSAWPSGHGTSTNASDRVIDELDASLEPSYRIESGTSAAAALVSGTVALIKQFFSERLHQHLTPALAKALVLNGAQPDAVTGISVRGPNNIQGWGALNLRATLHPGLTNTTGLSGSMFFRQDLALSTGESFRESFSLQPSGFQQPINVTLVWTDPPANPLVGIKLVNDLDLVVTNLDTGAVYRGNDFAAGAVWSTSWDGQSGPDFLNNVERIALPPGTGTNFTVSVHGRQITTDVTRSQYSAAAQDFALVVSCGDGSVADTIVRGQAQSDPATAEGYSILTNFTSYAANETGTFVWGDRIGANTPGTNTPAPGSVEPLTYADGGAQWRFYVVTNSGNFAHAAFVLFGATNLTMDPAAASGSLPNLDLYVSTDPALLQLGPAALQNAYKSVGNGDEWILSDPPSDCPYYIAVKCESGFGASFNLAVFFREAPFWTQVSQARYVLNGVPSVCTIPGVTNGDPSAGMVFALPPSGLPWMRRLVSSNVIAQAHADDVRMTLQKNRSQILLKDFGGAQGVDLRTYVIDDSAEGDFPEAEASADVKGLASYIGLPDGPFIYRYNSRGDAGTNFGASLIIDVESPESSTVLPGRTVNRYFQVPAQATNCSVNVELTQGQGPFTVEIAPLWKETNGFNQLRVSANSPAGVMTIDGTSDPALEPGVWRVRLRNDGPDQAAVSVFVTSNADEQRDPYTRVSMAAGGAIQDDSVTRFPIVVLTNGLIRDMRAGLRLSHPRLGDLLIGLMSPAGTRVMLSANRGGESTNGMGAEVTMTNLFPVLSSGGALVASNTFDLKKTSGVMKVKYDFLDKPDRMRIYYQGQVIFDSGLVAGNATTNISYGPGDDTSIVVVMNEGDNTDPDTWWYYEISSVYQDDGLLIFSDDPTRIPIRFSIPPFDAVNGASPCQYVRPEEPLSAFAGEQAEGVWTLEISDVYAGPADQTASLIAAELAFEFSPQGPEPVQLLSGSNLSFQLAPLQTRWLSVSLNPWTEVATNYLAGASLPLNLLFTTNVPPAVLGSVGLISNATFGAAVLGRNSSPPLPKNRYFLGLQNPGNDFVSGTVNVALAPAVTTLTNQLPLNDFVEASTSRYYTFFVGSPWRAQFRVWNLDGDVALYVRKGLPLPTETTNQFSSDNAGLQEELIVLRGDATPVALTPGTWFATVENRGSARSSYTIEGISWYEPAQPFAITASSTEGGQLSLTWRSLPGAVYTIEKSKDLNNPQWEPAAPAIVADSEITTAAITPDGDVLYLRIRE